MSKSKGVDAARHDDCIVRGEKMKTKRLQAGGHGVQKITKNIW